MVQQESKAYKTSYNIIYRNPIYDIPRIKQKFIPKDQREYRSLKIMYHKALPKYNMHAGEKAMFSMCYIGAGFMAVNMNNINKPKRKYTIYDKNSEYQYIQIAKGKDYPLSPARTYHNDIPDATKFMKDQKGKKYMAYCVFYGLKRKYNNIYYNTYLRQLNLLYSPYINDTFAHCGWLCDTDLNNILKLFNYNKFIIKKACVFKRAGSLGENVKNFILSKFEKLNKMERGTPERKDYKTMLHIATYGKNCQLKYENSRSKYILIGIYQAAYVREEMIRLMLKYIDTFAYIDTDSIFIYNNVDFKEKIGTNIGQFKVEAKNVKIYFFRFKGYVIWHKDKIEQKISGLNQQLSIDQINTLISGKSITVMENYGDDIRPFTIENKFKNGNTYEI